MSTLEIYLYAAGYIYFLAIETGKELIAKDKITAWEFGENVVMALFWPIAAPAFILGKIGAAIVRHIRKQVQS